MGDSNKLAYALTATARGYGTGRPVNARVRSNFAVQHMLAAARFARMSGEVEAVHAGDAPGTYFDEVISYVTATVLTASAGMEAYINELFIDSHIFFPEYREGTAKRLWEIVWSEIERKPLIVKYQIALDLKKQERFAKEDLTYHSATTLIKVRNELVHFKAQWDDEEKSHREVAARLKKEGVQTSPLAGDSDAFPLAFMSHDMAKWAVMTTLRFTTSFSQKAGLDNKYVGVMDRLNPGYATWPLIEA